jgi:hypothetical protein
LAKPQEGFGPLVRKWAIPVGIAAATSRSTLPITSLLASFWIVASLGQKRPGKKVPTKTSWTRGVFDKEARRKLLAFAADAV